MVAPVNLSSVGLTSLYGFRNSANQFSFAGVMPVAQKFEPAEGEAKQQRASADTRQGGQQSPDSWRRWFAYTPSAIA